MIHPGDDPRWAQPGFDDSAWGLIQPTEDQPAARREIARTAQRFGQEDDITILTLDWQQPVAERLSA